MSLSSTVRATMSVLTPYLGFTGGKCREAMTFYQECFGGDLDMKCFGDSSFANDTNKDHIMHSTLNINGKPFLMGSDGCGGLEGDAKISFSVDFQSDEELNEAFSRISEGGKVTMPLERQFWGAKFGQVTDKFGFPWMLHFQETADEHTAKKVKSED